MCNLLIIENVGRVFLTTLIFYVINVRLCSRSYSFNLIHFISLLFYHYLE